MLGGHNESVCNVGFSSDGELIATAALDGIVKIWDTAGNEISTLEGPGSDIEWVDWHPRGAVLLAGSTDVKRIELSL